MRWRNLSDQYVGCDVTCTHCVVISKYEFLFQIQIMQQQKSVTSKNSVKEKQPFEEPSADILPKDSKKSALPWQHDVATQTAPRSTGNDASCHHQCRHFVEVTVPDTSNDFVVNITKSRDPPPPYCETVYT